MIGEIELDDDLGVQDCRAWLDRALDRNDLLALADWAKQYGRSLCENASESVDLDNSGLITDLKADLAAEEEHSGELEIEADDLRKEVDALTAAIREAVKVIYPIAKHVNGATSGQQIIDALDELELAL